MGKILSERGHFQVMIAESEAEVRLAQKLRYDVFFRGRRTEGFAPEKGEGELDIDRFDPQFRHIVVLDRESGKAVGTYRFQSGVEAKRGLGFYSSTEYCLSGVEFDDSFFEVGRSCVAEEFRGGAVISLLWLGIHELHRLEHWRHLFGCVSFPEEQLAGAWNLYDAQAASAGLDDEIRGVPQPSYRVERPSTAETASAPLPPLLKGYLRLGAQIAGEPVLDKAFGTVDLLIHLDFDRVSERYLRHYQAEVRS